MTINYSSVIKNHVLSYNTKKLYISISFLKFKLNQLVIFYFRLNNKNIYIINI
jgi:hypothetical protein